MVFGEQKERGKAWNLKEKGWQTWLAREVSRKEKTKSRLPFGGKKGKQKKKKKRERVSREREE